MKWAAIAVSLCLVLVSCSPKQNDAVKKNDVRPDVKTDVKTGVKSDVKSDARTTVTLRAQGQTEAVVVKPWMKDGKVWIPADRAAQLFHYRYVWEPGSHIAEMGYTDPLYKFKIGSKKANVGDKTVLLNEAPRVKDDTLYLETSSLSQLWQTPVRWDAKTNSVVVMPPTASPNGNTLKAKSVGNAGDATEVITFAKQFMNTPYRFSAGPYEQTHAFDCSSFMQYIFRHVGINLPRSSRSQSNVGQLIDRDALMPGDLIFFNTPGRFSSNRIVGHVGLYIGNNQVIHTYGSPGVTITTLTESWNRRYLWARRVL